MHLLAVVLIPSLFYRVCAIAGRLQVGGRDISLAFAVSECPVHPCRAAPLPVLPLLLLFLLFVTRPAAIFASAVRWLRSGHLSEPGACAQDVRDPRLTNPFPFRFCFLCPYQAW